MTTLAMSAPAAGALKLRRDVIYMKTETGIVFRARRGAFALNGKTIYHSFQQLLPYLDGHTEREQLLGNLAAPARAPLAKLVDTLLSHGVIDTVDRADAQLLEPALARTFAPQLEFMAHYSQQPAARFLAFRNSRILLCGSGVALQSAGAALLRNGLRRLAVASDGPEDLEMLQQESQRLQAAGVDSGIAHSAADPTGYDLLVYCAEQPQLSVLQRLNRRARTGGCAFLPAFVHGGSALIGPVAQPQLPGCWHCTMLRWADNAPAQEANASWQALAGVRSAQAAPVAALPAQILGNNTAMEVFKHFIGAPAAESSRRLLVQDLHTLGSSLKSVLPHPDCPVCMAGAMAATAPAQQAEAGQAVRAWAPYMDAQYGKFRGFEDESIEQLPLRLAQLRLAGAGATPLVTGWSLSNSDAARQHALEGALALGAHDAPPLHLGSRCASAPGPSKVAPGALSAWLGNGPADGACRHWLAATRLGDGAQAWLPAGAIHPCYDSEQQFDPHGEGVGVGTDTAQALLRAVLSLAAQRALAGLADGSLPIRTLDDWQGRCGKDADYLWTAAQQLDYAGLELGLAESIPGVYCTFVRPAHGGAVADGDLLIGTGLDHAQAVTSLLAQLVARAQLERHDLQLNRPRRAGLYAVAELQLAWSGSVAMHESGAEPGLPQLAATLEQAGQQLYWIDVTAPDVAWTRTLRVVKAVLARAPGIAG